MEGITGDLAGSSGSERADEVFSHPERPIDWAAYLDAWAQSGLSMRAFAQREGLSLPALYYQRAKRRRRDGRNGERQVPDGASSPDLIDVTRLLRGAVGQSHSGASASPRGITGGVMITLPNGISVAWPVGDNVAHLGDVVRVLQAC